MNTPESDMEQMKFAREWVRAHAAKKMAKYEKKLRRAAKDFFGHPVAIAYLKPGVILEIKDTGEKAKIAVGEEAKRRYRELSMMYLDEKPYTVQEISEVENISDKTVYKDIGIACGIVAIYLLGADF